MNFNSLSAVSNCDQRRLFLYFDTSDLVLCEFSITRSSPFCSRIKCLGILKVKHLKRICFRNVELIQSKLKFKVS